MKFKIFFTITIIAGFLLLGLNSCNKYLEMPAQTSFNTDSVFSRYQNVERLIFDLYQFSKYFLLLSIQFFLVHFFNFLDPFQVANGKVNQETNILVRVYKKFLETHILKKPLWIDLIDKSLNPIMGKSTAMYFTKK